MAKISARQSRPIRKVFVSLPPTNEIKPTKPNKIMKKQYLQLICAVCMAVVAYGGIKKCQEREVAAKLEEPAAQQAEAAAQEAEEGPAPEMKHIEPAETADTVLTAEMERRYFEALVKIADGGKAYAIDADGKRSAKAFKTFNEYEKFITSNTQYIRNRYSYDADGKPFNIDFKPSPNGDGWQIQNKPQTDEPVPDVSFSIRPAKNE